MKLINAVFEGGGVKGISLAGAICATEEQGITFNRVAGTSSGAIVAALLAAGYTCREIRELLETTPFQSFLRRGFIYNLGVIGPALRLMVHGGFYSGAGLTGWIEQLLAKKGVRTFGDLPHCKLRIVASDISNGRLLVLPDDIVYYGQEPKKMNIAAAVRMSASIPYFFDPIRIRMMLPEGKHGPWSYIVDGGLLSNFPLWIFDTEQRGMEKPVPTVGYQMVGKNKTEPHRIRGPVSMFQAIFETMLQAHDERYIKRKNTDRTVKIPTLGIRTTQFHLSKEQSDQLFVSGYDAAAAFFEQATL
ncbi:patatin-like phospholipase family protein [Paenibacillus nasutitermitis]|uniref:Phospholipase n=1 Tax=Paenibacillus nasutitermitis TaxID=1652958 RepID=A0A916Z077_9BACL|nr:patatin-like phospholipase family protein [Paenibacillus nasutitermitis]GGD70288.1 phospholipase [Paenibacillus nasutitermitis]